MLNHDEALQLAVASNFGHILMESVMSLGKDTMHIIESRLDQPENPENEKLMDSVGNIASELVTMKGVIVAAISPWVEELEEYRLHFPQEAEKVMDELRVHPVILAMRDEFTKTNVDRIADILKDALDD